jgi:hypothetical protein
MYIHLLSESKNCAICIRFVYQTTRCPWGQIFSQQYVINFSETIIKRALVGLRVASEFDFTSTFFVWHMTGCSLLPNLWSLHLSQIISLHHNIQVLFDCKNKEWKVALRLSLKVLLSETYRQGWEQCMFQCYKSTLVHEYLAISFLIVCIKNISW